MFVLPANQTHCDRCRKLSLTVIVTVLAATFATQSLANGDDMPPRTLELRLVDEDQQPVSGALVTAVGLSIDGSAATAWGTDRYTEPAHRSDDLGRVLVEAPSISQAGHSVKAVVCRISHNDFVTVNTSVSFKDSPATVRLQRGRRIAVSAVDGHTGNRIKHDLFAILSKCFTNQEWRLLNNGVLVSEGVAFDRTHLRLIQLPKDGLPRFSDLIDLSKYDENRRILLHDIEVRDGLRLEGTLDPLVPRPIHNGIVRVVISEGGNDWQDGCDIRADGTFVVTSLPRAEVIQLTAICDGWISANPSKEEMTAVGMASKYRRLQPSRLYPQVFRSDEDLFQPVIRMNKAASCRVQVQDSGGKPIPDASIWLQPFQGSFDGRSLLVGQAENTRGFLARSQRKPTSTPQQTTIDGSLRALLRRTYTAVTNADGIATIDSLPGGPDGSPAMTSVHVSHPDYERPPNDGLGDRGLFRAALHLGQTAKIQFRLRKKH